MVVVLDVAGMKSDACCQKIHDAIVARDPDAEVVVMRIAGRVSVDAALDRDQLVRAVRDAGYPAQLAP